MPPSRKTKRTQRNYGWVAGGMPGLKHEAFIARGGFGEVHRVTARVSSLTMQMLNERTEQVTTECWFVCFSDDQVFARKIVRIFGDVTHEDAESEGQMLSELCQPGRSKAVVEVIKHGWLP